MSTEHLMVTFSGIVAIATVVELVLFYCTQREMRRFQGRAHDEIKGLEDRLVWLTGAMESHSSLMLRLEAKRYGIPVVWWDPAEEDWPKTGPHDTPADLEKIRTGMNPRDRKKPSTT